MRFMVREYELGRIRFLYTRISEPQTDDELRARLEDYKQRLQASQAKNMRDICIMDFVATAGYSAQQRRIQSDWNRETHELLAEVEQCLIFVTASAIMSGVITAVFWAAPPPFPYKVCSDVNEALMLAFEICEEAGVRVDNIAREHIRVCLFN